MLCRRLSRQSVDCGGLSMCLKEKQEEDELAMIPKNLWAVKKIEDCNFWFLKTGM